MLHCLLMKELAIPTFGDDLESASRPLMSFGD
jgi:hypothetical protein